MAHPPYDPYYIPPPPPPHQQHLQPPPAPPAPPPASAPPAAPPQYQHQLENGINTLFVSGLPDDVKPREIHNLFRRKHGFESCQLKYTGRGNQVAPFHSFSPEKIFNFLFVIREKCTNFCLFPEIIEDFTKKTQIFFFQFNLVCSSGILLCVFWLSSQFGFKLLKKV